MRHLLLPLFMLSAVSWAADDWPELKFPANAKIEVVADEMEYNGYPMRTWIARVPGNAADAAAFYQKNWQPHSERFDRREFNDDIIINSLQPPYLLTARLQQELGQTIALVGVTKNLDDKALKHIKASDMPIPLGTHLVSEVSSRDPGKQGKTTVLMSERGLSSGYEFYRDYYHRAGWQEVRSILDSSAGKASLRFNRGAEFVDISFSKKGAQIQIVAHRIKEGS